MAIDKKYKISSFKRCYDKWGSAVEDIVIEIDDILIEDIVIFFEDIVTTN